VSQAARRRHAPGAACPPPHWRARAARHPRCAGCRARPGGAAWRVSARAAHAQPRARGAACLVRLVLRQLLLQPVERDQLVAGQVELRPRAAVRVSGGACAPQPARRGARLAERQAAALRELVRQLRLRHRAARRQRRAARGSTAPAWRSGGCGVRGERARVRWRLRRGARPRLAGGRRAGRRAAQRPAAARWHAPSGLRRRGERGSFGVRSVAPCVGKELVGKCPRGVRGDLPDKSALAQAGPGVGPSPGHQATSSARYTARPRARAKAAVARAPRAVCARSRSAASPVRSSAARCASWSTPAPPRAQQNGHGSRCRAACRGATRVAQGAAAPPAAPPAAMHRVCADAPLSRRRRARAALGASEGCCVPPCA
jgi:hypothetical protein